MQNLITQAKKTLKPAKYNTWRSKYIDIINYIKNNHGEIPPDYSLYPDTHKRWFLQQRHRYKKAGLNKNQINLLQAINFSLETEQHKNEHRRRYWNKNFKLILSLIKSAKEKQIGYPKMVIRKIRYMQKRYLESTLTQQEKQHLLSINLILDPTIYSTKKQYQLFDELPLEHIDSLIETIQ